MPKIDEKELVYKNLRQEDVKFLLKNLGKKNQEIGKWVEMKKFRGNLAEGENRCYYEYDGLGRRVKKKSFLRDREQEMLFLCIFI